MLKLRDAIRVRSLAWALVFLASLVTLHANAESYGEFEFKGVGDFPSNYVQPFRGAFNESFRFNPGAGLIFSTPGSETRDLERRYVSRERYAAYSEARAPSGKQFNTSRIKHKTLYRKCSTDATLALTITEAYVQILDGGPRNDSDTHGDYRAAIEPDNIPQVHGVLLFDVHVVSVTHPRRRFFRASGLVYLELAVDEQGGRVWHFADTVFGTRPFWRGTQFALERRPGTAPRSQHIDLRLTAPNRVDVDLAQVAVAPSCPEDGEETADDQGVFEVQVELSAISRVDFRSEIETTYVRTGIRDPADLDDNDSGIVVEVSGAQRLAPPSELIVPAVDGTAPDPNCSAP